MNILAFAASNSQQSINKKLVTYAASLVNGATVRVLDLNDYELPLFSVDTEQEIGQPKLAQQFLDEIAQSDAIVVSFAEHNGSYTAAYKNLFDWCSRINPKVFQNKAMVCLSTSPGARGGASVLAAAVASAPFFGADVKGSMAIPSFNENFNSDSLQVSNAELNKQLVDVMALLSQ